MEYLHKNNIVLRDLKPNNVGWCETTGKLKIFDLGLAKEIRHGEKLTSVVGTPRYMGVEMITGEGYGFSCVVHAFGIVLWQLTSLQRGPFPRKTKGEVWELVAKEGKRPPLDSICCPKKISQLMEECWDASPQERPTFKAIRKRLVKVLRTLH